MAGNCVPHQNSVLVTMAATMAAAVAASATSYGVIEADGTAPTNARNEYAQAVQDVDGVQQQVVHVAVATQDDMRGAVPRPEKRWEHSGAGADWPTWRLQGDLARPWAQPIALQGTTRPNGAAVACCG